MKQLPVWIFGCFLLIYACQSETKTVLKPLDLLEYGIPVTILAPDSAKVKTMDMVVQKDVTIKGEKQDNYFVQLYASDATNNDIVRLKAEQLEQVKDNPYFSKIVKEDEAGFIYETQIDSTNINYGFRFVKLQGNKEYVFQTGLIGNFKLEDVETMYDAVQFEK